MKGELVFIGAGERTYPARLRRKLGADAPSALAARGNFDLLGGSLLGLLVSLHCPGTVTLETFDAVRGFREGMWPVVGGFHSPMERQCLESLLLRRVGVVVVLPRPLAGMRVPHGWCEPLDRGRLLLLSPFPEGNRRLTRERAHQRNVVVTALSDALFVPYAAEGGSVEHCVVLALEWRTPVLSVGANAHPLMRDRAGRVEEWADFRAGGRRPASM